MRYFGFDLGDGESCVALYSDQHTLPLTLPVHGQNSFFTAVGTFNGKIVVGELANNNPQTQNLHVCFKRNFRAAQPETDEIIKTFVTGVLSAIQDNSIARNIFQTEDYTFVVGCPADWSGQDRARYANLMMQAGLKNVRIVSESRAAFLTATMTDEASETSRQLLDSTLLIDLGSSTLDLAYVYDGREYTVNTMGVQLGGGMLDEMIVERALSTLCEEEQKVIRQIFLKESAWKSRLMVSARKLKEAYFTSNADQLMQKHEKIICEGRHNINLAISPDILEEMVERPSPLLEDESFLGRLQNCLLIAQQLMAARPPKVVLLTGGASRMQFFQEICRQAFPDAKMMISSTPESDIARGLACAGHVDEMMGYLRRDIAAYVESDAVERKVAAAMPELTDMLADMLTKEMISKVLRPEFIKWKTVETDTLKEMEEACLKRTEKLLHAPEWSATVSAAAKPWLDGVLLSVQHDLTDMCEKYAGGVHALQIQQAVLKMKSDVLPDGIPVPEMPLMDVLLNVVVAAVGAAICGGSGMALVATGPVGLVIGALIGMITLAVGRTAIQAWLDMLAKKFKRPALFDRVNDAIKEFSMPALLRKMASEKRLLGETGQKEMYQKIRTALAKDEQLQQGLCEQIGKCIDEAILSLTEEKTMAIV